jgi:hypothetical protein
MGKTIKQWIIFHAMNQTEYTRIAKRMVRYLNLSDGKLYRVVLRPESTACGQYKRYNPNVVALDKKRLDLGE